MSFVERCAPSSGVCEEAARETSAISRVLDPLCQSFMRRTEKRHIRVRTLEKRCRDNDWAFVSNPGVVERIEGSHPPEESPFLIGGNDPAAVSLNGTDVDCMTVLAINYRRQDHRRAGTKP